MPNYTLYLIIFGVLVTISHGTFLKMAQRRQMASSEEKTRLWHLHLALNGTLWLALLAGVALQQFLAERTEQPIHYKILGAILCLLGVGIVYKVRMLLGRDQAMGIRFFFPERAKYIRHNLYKYLNNPMYDGFILVFVGLALLFGVQENYHLAIASFLMLNIGLASIENYQLSWKVL